MNEDYLEFSLKDVDDTSFLEKNEQIICQHCMIISFIYYGSKEPKEIIDFSQYNSKTNNGFVVWGNYYTEKGISEMTIHSNCMISCRVCSDSHLEFYWWPAGTVTFLEDTI